MLAGASVLAELLRYRSKNCTVDQTFDGQKIMPAGAPVLAELLSLRSVLKIDFYQSGNHACAGWATELPITFSWGESKIQNNSLFVVMLKTCMGWDANTMSACASRPVYYIFPKKTWNKIDRACNDNPNAAAGEYQPAQLVQQSLFYASLILLTSKKFNIIREA